MPGLGAVWMTPEGALRGPLGPLSRNARVVQRAFAVPDSTGDQRRRTGVVPSVSAESWSFLKSPLPRCTTSLG